jgi:hypothetical protein
MAEYKIEKKKIIFNADFKPSVDFFPKQYDLIKKYNIDFPHWELSGISFTMQDKTEHCSALVTHKKIIFEWDDATTKVDAAKQRISNVLRSYNELLPIDSFLRIGVRFFMFVPMIEIKKEELADIIQTKLFANSKEISEIFPEKLNDLAYIRDYPQDGFLYHLKCGPMPEEHIPAWVDFGEGKHRWETTKAFKDYLDSFPKISIFFDVDCYKTDVIFGDVGQFLEKAFNNCLQTAANLKKYILGA